MKYSVESGGIAGKNAPYFNNRPLYGDHRPAVTMAGDRPHVRFACKGNVFGCMTWGVLRGSTAKWLHDAEEVKCRYWPGHMEWQVSDMEFAGLDAAIDVVPLAGSDGFAAKLRARGGRPGDRLIWAFGGAMSCSDASREFDPVVANQNNQVIAAFSPVLQDRFEPEDCRGNLVSINLGRFVLTTTGNSVRNLIGCCTVGALHLADASRWCEPEKLFESEADQLPLACGMVELSDDTEVYWAVEAVDEMENESAACQDAAGAFEKALKRVEVLGQKVIVRTPEPTLDAAVAAACYAQDSTFYPPVYVHGAMAWNIPFPGWRSLYGATAFGWHENVKTQARYYIASQNRETTERVPVANPERRLCTQGRDSCLFGRGRIVQDGSIYNFQTQFFDQLIHAWRWTGDRELELLLREALELHMEWAKICFDPDEDGLYENYINTWPTDSVWFNGGGCAEETSYAFAGYRALADLARNRGDEAAVRRYEAQAAKIRRALLQTLWLERKGYMAQYKESGGLERVHEDSWLGAIFLPVETGLLDEEHSVQALHYTEWGLERISMPYGGSRCWMSNWVPAVWSVREMYPGDNYALALACFRTGLSSEGWYLLRGNYLESMYHGIVPGGLACSNGGTDFSDVLSMFGRTVVEGLFGYRPDYPNGCVLLAPQFPAEWEHASIATPDFELQLNSETGKQEWHVTLTRASTLRLEMPVRAQEVAGVEVNGQPVTWKSRPGFGCSVISVEMADCRAMHVVMRMVPSENTGEKSIRLKALVGQTMHLRAGELNIEEWRDPQGVLVGACLHQGGIVASAASNPGHHQVQALVREGSLTQWCLFKIEIEDPADHAEAAARRAPQVSKDTRWDCCDISPFLNADVTGIYKQKYLSPRPKSCSTSIGVDGYSPWTFAYWKIDPPAVDLSNIHNMMDDQGLLLTPQGVPFRWGGNESNIAFVSLWDNWPREVALPVNRTGEGVWLLICGTTNPMQCRIANARIRLLYSDGVVDDLDIVPPINFWTLCPIGVRDYDYARDAFALPETPPDTVQLGRNCRAVLLNHSLRKGVELKQVVLEALSQEVVIGIMGVTLT